MAESKEVFDWITFEQTELMDLGDRVLALGRVEARGHEGGVDLDYPCGWLHTLRNGKLIAAEGFIDHAEARRAAGLA
jgi:ketosteroid isomerase-like protein